MLAGCLFERRLKIGDKRRAISSSISGVEWKSILFYLSIQFIQKTMNNTKKKSDVAATLDDLRSEDAKKRMGAIGNIKEVAAALGPARVRSELIGFLAEFIDDEENIVLELLNQLNSFATSLGGPQHEKMLLPLLISFCKTDERKVALKSCSIIERICKANKDLAIEIIKKLMKVDMNLSKECGLQLMASLFPLLQSNQSTLLELYTPLFNSDNLQLKIIASKYLHPITRQLKNKEEITKVLEVIYNEGGELEKIYALEALIEFYDSNNNFSLTKFKHLSVINSWRINIKICELASKISDKVQKSHFKLIFEPMFLKFMGSTEPELKAAACKTIGAVCKNMSDDEHKNKLQGSLKKLTADQTEYVKVELARNIVPICSIVSNEFMAECLLPNILGFMKDPNSEVALAVAENFEFLASKMNKQALEEKIIKPLLQQLSTNNWRIKCEIIKILRTFLLDQTYLSQDVLKVFVSLTDDRIDAVRLNANKLIVEILSRNSKEWCEQHVIPKVFASRDNISYIKKQNLLDIIEKTSSCVSDKTLKETYQSTIISYINDKVPNVRLKTIQVIKGNSKLSCPTIDKHVEKLRDDKDNEIREFAKKLRA